MGNYITQADIEARHTSDDVIAVVDDEHVGSLTPTSVARITAAIVDAEGEVDAVLAQHGLAVPLSTVPARVVTLTVTIAWYYLNRRRVPTPQSVEEDYEDALEKLKRLAETGAHGGDPEPSMTTARKPRVNSSERIFTDDGMDGF